MRKNYHTLSDIVTDALGRDPCDGSVCIFMNRARNRIKPLPWEPGRMVIYSKLLEVGTFGLHSKPTSRRRRTPSPIP